MNGRFTQNQVKPSFKKGKIWHKKKSQTGGSTPFNISLFRHVKAQSDPFLSLSNQFVKDTHLGVVFHILLEFIAPILLKI